MRRIAFFLITMAALAGCERERAEPDSPAARDSSGARAPDSTASRARTVDSALTMVEYVRRFRATIDETPTRLEGGERSRDALVRSFGEAVQRRDTAALRRMHVSRAEFAYLFFPSNPVARPPYELDPALLWFRLAGETEKGVPRLLERHGGPEFVLVGHDCAPEPELQGENRLWGPCITRFRARAGDTLALQLFGPILERDGRFKFVSYFNKL